MQLIRITMGDYSQYEELLLKRDELKKESELIFVEHTRIFGDIATEIFMLKIDCISLKKSISYCVAAKNRGEAVAREKLQEYIDNVMVNYKAELDEMVRQNELSKQSEKISAFQVREIKRIYRKIAKMLHPDISNVTEKHPALADLFQRVLIAYQCNDYKEIKELEVVVNASLGKLGKEKFEVAIPNIEEKIIELEDEIRSIITNEPYTYREILDNPESVEQKMREMKEERDSYCDYKKELELKLSELLENTNE